ncbi:hypothetical protein GCM10009552_09870 [Rothia nasimurium]
MRGLGEGARHGDVEPAVGIQVEAFLILGHGKDAPAQVFVPWMREARDKRGPFVAEADQRGIDAIRAGARYEAYVEAVV